MDKEKKKILFRIIICVAVLATVIPLGFLTNIFNPATWNITFDLSVLLKLLILIAVVIAVEALLVMILGAIKVQNHRVRSILSIVSSLLKYVAGIVILCGGLSILGVNLSTIVASVGILALIVGFSAESLIADVVTGAFMLFENQYNVGDIVEVDNFRGTVTNIGIRTTCITDPGDNVKIVNNSAMRNILNRSDKLSRSVSDIAIPYGTDLEKLESEIPGLMEEIYNKRSDMMKKPPVYLGVQSLADSAVVLRFVVNVDEKDIYSGARVLNHDLLLGFRHLGVECPFPQVDVHTD
ncbi:MAG: mechanosensitive ion channel [Eubacteriales bacterium]|nr:mechanosensitive ion channel [Eubacteriales bacterium]